MKVGHRRCKCQKCGEYFNSVAAFDKHRKGPWDSRYCDTSKLFKSSSGYWVTALQPLDLKEWDEMQPVGREEI